MRMRKKKNLAQRMERCAACWIQKPEEHRDNWRTLMPQAREVRLELGCGKGRFTCETAKALPDVLFIAVERVPDAMVVAMERVMTEELKNVFFIDGDAANLAAYFAPDEVDGIYINFCDPWPGKRHAKRRLTHQNFLRAYRDILCAEGYVWFKTDNADLFSFSLMQFPHAGYGLEEVTRDLHAEGITGIMTDYEEKFHNEGIKINRCVGKKSALELAGQ